MNRDGLRSAKSMPPPAPVLSGEHDALFRAMSRRSRQQMEIETDSARPRLRSSLAALGGARLASPARSNPPRSPGSGAAAGPARGLPLSRPTSRQTEAAPLADEHTDIFRAISERSWGMAATPSVASAPSDLRRGFHQVLPPVRSRTDYRPGSAESYCSTCSPSDDEDERERTMLEQSDQLAAALAVMPRDQAVIVVPPSDTRARRRNSRLHEYRNFREAQRRHRRSFGREHERHSHGGSEYLPLPSEYGYDGGHGHGHGHHHGRRHGRRDHSTPTHRHHRHRHHRHHGQPAAALSGAGSEFGDAPYDYPQDAASFQHTRQRQTADSFFGDYYPEPASPPGDGNHGRHQHHHASTHGHSHHNTRGPQPQHQRGHQHPPRGHDPRPGAAALTRHLARPTVGVALVDDFVDECLVQEILPAMVDAVARDMGKGHQIYHSADGYVPSVMFLSLLDEVLPAMLRQIAVDTTQEMVRSYFLRKGQTYEHPLIRLAKDMIYEVLDAEAEAVVKEAIAGMVQDHLRDQRATEFFEFQLYPEALDAVLRDVAEEVIVEGFEEQLLTQVMDAVIVPDGRQAAVEALKESSSETRKQQMQIVSDFASDKLIEGLMLERLLEHVACDMDTMVLQEYSERVFGSMAITMLLENYLKIAGELRKTEENVVLRAAHTEAVMDLALGVLSAELVEQLDENLATIHQREVCRREQDQYALGGAFSGGVASDAMLDMRFWLDDN